MLGRRTQKFGFAAALPLALTVSVAAHAQAKSSLFSRADSVSAEVPSKIIEARVWLNLHDKKGLDETVSKLYEPHSPSYRHWLKNGDLAHFLPTAADIETVKSELTSQGLKVESVGPHNMYLNVSGSVTRMETAFHTDIKSLSVKGEIVRATTTTPKLAGSAGNLVAAVGGLTQNKMSPHSMRLVEPGTKKPYAGVPLKAKPSASGNPYSANCFRDVQTQVFKTPGAQLPLATYTGNRYGANIANTALGTLAPCGYNPMNMTTAYGLQAAYKEGLDGSGQTIVIVDAYGSPTIADDANAFSSMNGLPALTSSNFEVLYPLGPPTATTPENAAGWAAETTLDVEWAHAIAPGAAIVLIAAPSAYDNDLASSIFYALSSGIGSVISNSYGEPELFEDLAGLYVWDSVTQLGAALGVSVNFSTGDYGDYEAVIGAKSASSPSDATYATAVGGTSLALYSSSRMKFQTGWGLNFDRIAEATLAPTTPPLAFGFQDGSGGGESVYFLKPSWQSALPGTGRQQPDVSLDADPQTGAEIVFTDGGVQSLEVYGGTSLSCPMFSAFWAIANQKAGRLHGKGTLLGLAAPTVARLAGTGAITDVTAYTSTTNVAGVIFDANGATYYSPDQLAGPLENTTSYYSALYNSPASGRWDVFTFGTDSSLVVEPGWDNVTGYGTPYGLNFINAAAK